MRRLEIDREIVNGGNLSNIARNFGVPYYSLYTHSKEHVSRQLSQAWEKKQTEENFNLLEKIDRIITRAEKIFRRNYAVGKDNIALKALDSQRTTIELLAKISYSLHQAKLAELEILKQSSGQADAEVNEIKQEEMSDAIKHALSDEERDLYFQLVKKLLDYTQGFFPTQEPIIRKELGTYTEPERYDEDVEENTQEIEEPDEYEELQVRPLKSNPIPFKRTKFVGGEKY